MITNKKNKYILLAGLAVILMVSSFSLYFREVQEKEEKEQKEAANENGSKDLKITKSESLCKEDYTNIGCNSFY